LIIKSPLLNVPVCPVALLGRCFHSISRSKSFTFSPARAGAGGHTLLFDTTASRAPLERLLLAAGDPARRVRLLDLAEYLTLRLFNLPIQLALEVVDARLDPNVDRRLDVVGGVCSLIPAR
jgi:hypothetical protein